MTTPSHPTAPATTGGPSAEDFAWADADATTIARIVAKKHFDQEKLLTRAQLHAWTFNAAKEIIAHRITALNQHSALVAQVVELTAWKDAAIVRYDALFTTNAELRRALANMYRRASSTASHAFLESDDQYRQARALLAPREETP